MNDSAVRVSRAMNKIADEIDSIIEEVAGERIGFCLLVFTPERASYISNCDRSDTIREMQKLLAYWDAGMPDIKAHDVI